MGLQTATAIEQRKRAMNWMLRDLHALEQMLADDMFDQSHPRSGAEQELFLIDRAWHAIVRKLKSFTGQSATDAAEAT